jgi:hypothetical protein
VAAHKYWRARAFGFNGNVAPFPLEISEFHLYNGAVRVDAAATLTASVPPSGALGNLKDDNTGTGCLWANDGNLVELTWTFPTAQNVTGIVVGARTTLARWPGSVLLAGGDATTGAGPSPEYTEHQFYGLGRFASATKTGILTPVGPHVPMPVTSRDMLLCSGIGRVPFKVVREVSPPTTPKTYADQYAHVFLRRFIDNKVVRQMWVKGSGAFENIDENYLYTVEAVYPDSGYRAVIADRIKPEGAPALETP